MAASMMLFSAMTLFFLSDSRWRSRPARSERRNAIFFSDCAESFKDLRVHRTNFQGSEYHVLSLWNPGHQCLSKFLVDVEGAYLLEHRSLDIFTSEQPLGHLFARPCRTHQSFLDDINEVSLEPTKVCLFLV